MVSMKRGREETATPAKRARIDLRLPKDWIECPRHGDLIAGAIIPSKLPLREALNQAIEPGKRYGLERLPHGVRLIIDLTNTEKYYPLSDLKHIKHIKIPCKGRNEVPDPASVNTFVYEVHRFIRRKENRGFKVLVNCTHGFNRTGFMIVNYLIRYQAYTLGKAVKEFAQARPPGIYKPSYLRSLYRLHGESFQESFAPPLPAWKSRDELEEEKEEFEAAQKSPSLLGDPIPTEQQWELQQMCMSLLDQPTTHRSFSFPGSHPVSLDREKMLTLRHKYYVVGSKADGTRYMMLLLHHGCYLIDRSFNFMRVEMRFPTKGLESVHNGTLVDGEMVIDGSQPRYLIFDVMALNSVNVHKRRFMERWGLITPEIIFPKQQEPSKHNEPFGVRRKDFYLLSAAEKMPQGMSKTGTHGWDGFIFQGVDEPYVCETDTGLFKWKFADMNSVDFLLKSSGAGEYVLALGGTHRVLQGASVIFPGDVDPSSLEGQVIECFWNPQKSSWQFMRPRPDKKQCPNSFNTYKKVWTSIVDNITQAQLFEELRSIMELPLYKERNPAVIQELLRASKLPRPPFKKVCVLNTTPDSTLASESWPGVRGELCVRV